MSIEQWMTSFTTDWANKPWSLVVKVVYFTAIIIAIGAMYGRGEFVAPHFVYQEF